MAFVKVGFHGGGGGNHNGIGDYLHQLDTAGVPFVLKSVNNVGLAVEGATLAKASGVPHVIILRWPNPGVPPGPQVPDYSKSPLSEARKNWGRVEQSFAHAPEFEQFKHLIWVESINEPRTEPDAGDPEFEGMHPCDWLGWFSYYVTLLSREAGYKYAAFSMNAGTPEPEDWKRPGMVEYLKNCAMYPNELAVALHEYTFQTDKPMSEFKPFLIGRFEALHKACDEMQIARPTILLTEGGWTYNDMPGETDAMNDVKWLSKFIAEFRNVLGMNLWTLEGPSALPNKLQKLITPITEYALNTTFPDIDPPPQNGDDMPPNKIKHTIHLLPQNTTLSELQSVTTELHPTRSAFTYSADAASDLVLAGTDKSMVIVWEGERWPDDIFAWLDVRGVKWITRQFANDTPPPPPPPGNGNAKIGLHASADPPMQPGDFQEFANLKPDMIKVLSFQEPDHIQRLVNDHPDAIWVVRAFLAMFQNGQPRNISPVQFFNDTISDVKRTLNILQGKKKVVELGNEPNLRTEGLDGAWADGITFATWFIELLSLYRAAIPGMKFLYPGLSPGHSFDDGVQRRINHIKFVEDSSAAVLVSDGLGVHAYWANKSDMLNALSVVDIYISRFPNFRIWITEASNNKSGDADDMAAQYVSFWQHMKNRSPVQGVTYFVASATDPKFTDEVWNGRNIGAKIAALIPG